MLNDFRFALRMITSRPWFSAAVIATLALGIGLNTMIFTLINAALFKPVPVPGGERLVTVNNGNGSHDNGLTGISYPDFREYRTQASTAMEALEAATGGIGILSEKGNPPHTYRMNRISSGLFGMLHMQPVLGRAFNRDDDKAGAAPVLLLGYGVWNDRYGRSPGVIGRVVRVNSKPATIIGVMPAGLRFPNDEDMWMPLVPDSDLEDRSHHWLQMFGIRKPGVAMGQASADLERIAGRLAADHPEDKGLGVVLQTFHQRYNGGPIRMVFLLMLASVGFVLLIACANVANMMLGRALGRQREISIRGAMGASRWQLIRQLLIESLMLSVIGGSVGLALSTQGIHWFDLHTQDVGKPYWVQFAMDYQVFAYFAALCIASGLLFGLAPALRSSSPDLNSALKEGSRSMGTHRGGLLSGVLVVFQFALTLVLLTGAGMFARGFLESESLNSNVPSDRLLTARVTLPRARYGNPDARLHFFEQLMPRVAALPGVTSSFMVSNPPGLGARSDHIEIEHREIPDAAHRPSASFVVLSPGYFQAVNLPLLVGRDFNGTDGGAGKEAVIVSKTFAGHFWPNQSALGKRFRIFRDDGTPNATPPKAGPWLSVIGVSSDLDQEPFEATPNPLAFLPYRQERYDSMALMVRTAANPASLTLAMRAAVQDLDQDLPLSEASTLTDAVEHQQWYIRLFGTLFLSFALIALLIASVGIYAVIAQTTASRTQEIGVRMALGATSRNVLGMVIGRGAKQLAAGLLLGLAAAYPGARLMQKILTRVSPTDPPVFGAVSLVLIAVGLFACWLPARRAAALDPVKAIRYE
jgi:putative ABC transport system permease protein